jgi:nicotinamide phosphoribosyltransferase
MPEQLRLNPIWNTDSYKLGHWTQYPPDTQFIESHLMSRGGFFKHTLFQGLQGILKANYTGVVFTKADVDEARFLSKLHFGSDEVFNYAGWTRLLEKHGGKLPLRIRAPKEGTLVGTKNVLMSIVNTDPEFPWLTNWAETILLQVWYPITVGTLSFKIRQAIGMDLVRTGDPAGLDFKLHDFGFRGVSSKETAAIGGASHLFNFHGTDTLAAIQYVRQYYGGKEPGNLMPGYSIPAMEHSTVTSWGKPGEAEAYRNMLRKNPKGLAACVVDSYDTNNAVDHIFGDDLREMVLRRDGTVVLRPDSGDPTVVIEDIFNSVANKFGFTTNDKGYKVLPSQVRVIQGDGVNYQNILRINSHLTRSTWSMDNWGYGMGGALLQQLNRDTQRFAIKCNAINRAGVWTPVFKDPATDHSKASIGGHGFSLVDRSVNHSGDYTTVVSGDSDAYGNELDVVLLDGDLKKDWSFQEVWDEARLHDSYVEEAQEAYA